MNKIINFNGLRSLVKKQEIKRPVLTSLHIKDGVAYATDSYVLVEMKGYEKTPDQTIDLFSFRVPAAPYPNVSTLINYEYKPIEIKTEVLNGELIYNLKEEGGMINYIDQGHLDQIKKLVSLKGFKLDPNALLFNPSRTVAKAIISKDPEVNIYVMVKRMGVDREE